MEKIKKISVKALAVAMCFSFCSYTSAYEQSLPAVSEAPVETRLGTLYSGTGEIKSLKDYWETNGFPDDIGYAYIHEIVVPDSETGIKTKYTCQQIGIIDADEKRKQEICALASPYYKILFADCGVSYKERTAVKEEIQKLYDKAEVFLAEQYSTVWVRLDKYYGEERKRIEGEIRSKYYDKEGERFVEIDSEMYPEGNCDMTSENKIHDAIDNKEPPDKKDDSLMAVVDTNKGQGSDTGFLLFISACIIVLAAVVITVILKIRSSRLLRTNTGVSLSVNHGLSKKETVNAVKSSEFAPDKQCLEKIITEIRTNDADF